MQEKAAITESSNCKEVDIQANIITKCDPNGDLMTNMTKTLATLSTETSGGSDASNDTNKLDRTIDNKTIESKMECQQQQQTKLNNSNAENTTTAQQTQTNNSAHIVRPAKRTANDYRFGKTIGEGSFSTVYLAKDIYTNKEVASKLKSGLSLSILWIRRELIFFRLFSRCSQSVRETVDHSRKKGTLHKA